MADKDAASSNGDHANDLGVESSTGGDDVDAATDDGSANHIHSHTPHTSNIRQSPQTYTHSPKYNQDGSYKPYYTGLIAPSRFANSHLQSYTQSATSGPSSPSSRFMLRQSLLAHHIRPCNNSDSSLVTSTGASLLKPARLPAPHSPSHEVAGDDGQNVVSSSTQASSRATNTFGTHKDDSDVTTSNGSTACNHHPTTENYFSTSVDSKNRSTPQENGGYVFGQNLADRVTGVSSSTALNTEVSGGASEGSPHHTTEYVFGQNSAPAGTELAAFGSSDGDDSAIERGACSLVESARDYQAKHDNKHNLEEIEVMTGEENEANVLQVNCKLYVHEKSAQNWLERGQGVLRLNDMAATDSEVFQSRLVMRTHGSFKLILNTKIWPNMMLERASPRSIRLSGRDIDDSIKVFLIMSSQKESENILSALDWRIQKLRAMHEQNRTSAERTTPTEKRRHDEDKEESPKRFKSDKENAIMPDDRIPLTEESTDSSVPDPETEASSGSRSSSVLGRSESD